MQTVKLKKVKKKQQDRSTGVQDLERHKVQVQQVKITAHRYKVALRVPEIAVKVLQKQLRQKNLCNKQRTMKSLVPMVHKKI